MTGNASATTDGRIVLNKRATMYPLLRGLLHRNVPEEAIKRVASRQQETARRGA